MPTPVFVIQKTNYEGINHKLLNNDNKEISLIRNMNSSDLIITFYNE